MEELLGAVNSNDVVGRWFYPDDYAEWTRECGLSYMEFNADGTALMVQYDRIDEQCERYEYPHTWSLQMDTIYMRMNGETTNRIIIMALDATSMRVRANGGGLFEEMVFTKG